MLRGLDIRDILIIDRLEIAFQPGLNVLTGETGAGKSILLDALGFVLGWRGQADIVRHGAETGEVAAVFELGAEHPARGVLRDAGLDTGDEVILRRTNAPGGRKAAWVNDRRVSGEVLRRLSAALVELHGQHDDRGLLDPRGHRALLDAVARHDGMRAQVRAGWTALAAARKAEADAAAEIAEVRAEEDFLRHAVGELDALAPAAGEDADLDAKRRLMQGAERVRVDIARAVASVAGEDGAAAQAAAALRWLDAAAEHLGDGLSGPLGALDRALSELAEAEAGLSDCLRALDFDPLELERIEERFFAIRALARKHDVAPDDLSDLAVGLRDRLAGLDRSTAHLAALARATGDAHREFLSAAALLTASRHAAAGRLDTAMAAELTPLRMERAVFTTEVAGAPPGPDGADAVRFTVATNPGAPAGPLDKIASGGELSRFLLALKVCLTADAAGLTLIFDEIDRGVGGATAAAVGRRLAALAGAPGGQVLVVTHSPQVAARGVHHWRVEKHVSAGQTRSTVVPLEPAARVDEIARMLSGDEITDEARQAARALLAG